MVSVDANAPAFAASVVVDLIGDLDATLGTLLAETLLKLAANGTRGVLLTTKHVTTVSSAGIASLGAALRSARERGLEIVLDAGSRKMRMALAGARIECATEAVAPPDRVRHYMFAHHETPKRPRQRALAHAL
jgi:anti-anti-sigma factor